MTLPEALPGPVMGCGADSGLSALAPLPFILHTLAGLIFLKTEMKLCWGPA